MTIASLPLSFLLKPNFPSPLIHPPPSTTLISNFHCFLFYAFHLGSFSTHNHSSSLTLLLKAFSLLCVSCISTQNFFSTSLCVHLSFLFSPFSPSTSHTLLTHSLHTLLSFHGHMSPLLLLILISTYFFMRP